MTGMCRWFLFFVSVEGETAFAASGCFLIWL